MADSFPKISFGTLLNFEMAGIVAPDEVNREAEPSLRFDSIFLVDINDKLSLDALYQFKPRQPRPANDPNRNLFINQGTGRREGGKFKELYLRYGDYLVGKFVQDFGRAYALLPGPYAADFIEEGDEGYEPSDMIGVERLHVFDNEDYGWQQLSISAFLFDQTVLHESFPYNEGLVRYRDGGLGNTHLPENIMVTYDVLNMPVGHFGQLTLQASAIRWGKSFDAEKAERWATLGGDLAIPLHGSVASTLEGSYSQLRLYVEGATRRDFKGFAGRNRNFVSASIAYLDGPWQIDMTTTQRWTTDYLFPLQKDQLYTATVGYSFPSQTVLSFSIANELVDHRHGNYVGIRLTQNFTNCSRCRIKGHAY